MSLKLTMHVKWLMSEVDAWLRDGVITDKQALAIRGRYPAAEERNWGMTVITAVGSVIFGLGIILIIAYNWEKMGRYVKLLLIFASMLAAHAAGLYFTREESPRKGLGEGVSLLGTMLFGAAIWLIAQVYHIDEHYPNGLLAWGIGAWAMAWAMPSIAQCILAVTILSFWGGFESMEFRNVHHLAPLVILACALPLAWVKRSRVLLAAGVAGAYVSLALNIVPYDDDIAAPLLLLAAAVTILAGRMLEPDDFFPGSAAVLSTAGFVPYVALLYAFSFREVARRMLRSVGDGDAYFIIFCVLAGIMAVLVPVVRYFRERKINAALAAESAGVFAIIALFIFKFVEASNIAKLTATLHATLPARDALERIHHITRFEGWPLAAAFNIILLLYCFMLTWDGVRTGSAKRTSLGVALFGLLAFTRYVDLFDDLVVRGLVFLAVGGTIFAVGALYSRFRKSGEVRP